MIIHFRRISKAAALYAKALLGGVRRALQIYSIGEGTQRLEGVTGGTPTAEEMWHGHAEGNLIVALKSMTIAPIAPEAWQTARLLRAILSSRLEIGGRIPPINGHSLE